jgi:hypothetical protein
MGPPLKPWKSRFCVLILLAFDKGSAYVEWMSIPLLHCAITSSLGWGSICQIFLPRLRTHSVQHLQCGPVPCSESVLKTVCWMNGYKVLNKGGAYKGRIREVTKLETHGCSVHLGLRHRSTFKWRAMKPGAVRLLHLEHAWFHSLT